MHIVLPVELDHAFRLLPCLFHLTGTFLQNKIACRTSLLRQCTLIVSLSINYLIEITMEI